MSDYVPVSLDPVLTIVEALSRTGSPEDLQRPPIAKRVVEQATAAIRENAELADKVVTALYPEGIIPTASFYDRLADVVHELGHHDGVYELSGLIWARSFSKLDSPTCFELLDSFALDNSHSFFIGLYALPTLLRNLELPVDYFSHWILSVRARLGNDGASGGFWNALSAYAAAWPDRALKVAETLSSNPAEENIITIAANLIGHLRTTIPDSSALSNLIERLRDHQHVDRRLIYHRSWVTTALQRVLTKEEFSDCIRRTSLGTKEEIDEGFHVLRILLPQASAEDESFLLGLRWLHERATKETSDLWKHFVIVLARQLHERWEAVGKPAGLPPLSELVIAIIPIRDDHKGTWNELEALLVFLLDRDPSTFIKLIFDLARKETEALSKRFRSRQDFNDLKAALNSQYGGEIVLDALLSDDDAVRHLGYSLFQALQLSALPSVRLDAVSDDRIALLIFSFQLEPFYDKVIARFLLALESRVRLGSESLQQLFIDELIYQSKNLPGECLDTLKKRIDDSFLVRRAVEQSEGYFAALRPCFRSAINSMGIPGLDRAARVKAARQNREMRAQMNKSSIFTQLCATSYTLYGGNEWQTFMGGKLGQVSEMQQISHSAEVPRMPGIDPEGIAIRRHHATVMIRALLTAETSRKPQ